MRKLSILQPIPQNMSKLSRETRKYNVENGKIIRLNQIKYIETGVRERVNLKFPGYTNNRNKDSIRAIADGCCGYCGLRIDSQNTTVVEHYKPKAELHFRKNEMQLEGIDKPMIERTGTFGKDSDICLHGYFMDGNYAENLLPACEACNTGQGNNGIFVHNKKSKGNIEYKIPYGKKNFFPILFSQRNASGKLIDHRINKLFISDRAMDKPLLFNPYIDDPYELFTMKFDNRFVAANGIGHIIKIIPNKNASDFQRLKAKVSINLLGLNREDLCLARYKKYEAFSLLHLSMQEEVANRRFQLNVWSKFALNFSKEFNKDNANMIGLGMYIGQRTGFNLRNILITEFPVQSNGILNHTIFFMDLVEELSSFAATYYNPSQIHQTTIRDLQESILMG